LIIILIPGKGSSKLLEELFNSGLDSIAAVDNTLLDVTAISDEEENQIGTNLKRRILAENKSGTNHKHRPSDVLQKLLPHCQRKAIKYDTSIIKEDEFNAYTVAGGKIFLNTGLLENLNNVDELAFVIAHEIAHNELKHCIHMIQYSYHASKIQPTLGALVQLAYSSYKHPFSKEEERQADEYAVHLMCKAGFKKSGAVSFFRALEKQEAKWYNANLRAVNDFISTHPTAVERRQRIEQITTP